MASSIKKLDWIQDGIDDTESGAIQDLLYIAVTSRSVVASIVSLSWVQDGIHDVEAGAFRWLNNIGSAEVASSVVSLGWVEDGIEEVEVKAIEGISYIDYGDSKVASSVVSLGWAQDGIEDSEVDLIDALKRFDNEQGSGRGIADSGHAFPDRNRPGRHFRIGCTGRLGGLQVPESLEQILAHPSLAPGIADALTPIVAMLYGVAKTNPSLIELLLTRPR